MNYRRDLSSKLLDGLLPAAVLYLLNLLVIMPTGLIEFNFKRSGLLVFMIGLMAVAMFSLQRALVARFSETVRAWYGVAGGLLAWLVVETGSRLDGNAFPSPTAALLLVMSGLVTLLLWRSLPLGARFFMVACQAYGIERLILAFIEPFAAWSPALRVLHIGAGVAAIAGMLGVLMWMLVFSERRTQRMWAALAAALLAIAAFYIFM